MQRGPRQLAIEKRPTNWHHSLQLRTYSTLARQKRLCLVQVLLRLPSQ